MERVPKISALTSHLLIAVLALLALTAIEYIPGFAGENTLNLYLGCAAAVIYWAVTHHIESNAAKSPGPGALTVFLRSTLIKLGATIGIIFLFTLTGLISPLYFAIGFYVTFSFYMMNFTLKQYNTVTQ